jgi:hypothetical protein
LKLNEKMSGSKEDQSYDELVRLANDPTISNEEREVYRARLKVLFGARLREGFGFASQQIRPVAQRRHS